MQKRLTMLFKATTMTSLSLKPADTMLNDLLSDSPFKLLCEHMEMAARCARVLSPYFDALLNGDWEKAEALFNEAKQLEHRADELKQKVRSHLYANKLMLIMSKGDTIALLSSQDQIANQARDIMGSLLGRRFRLPNDHTIDTLKELVGTTVEACNLAQTITQSLSDIMETSWSKKEKETIYHKLEELDALESQSDHLERALRVHLYQVEDALKPIDAMFLYTNIGNLGTLADTAQHVGHRLLLLLSQ